MTRDRRIKMAEELDIMLTFPTSKLRRKKNTSIFRTIHTEHLLNAVRRT